MNETLDNGRIVEDKIEVGIKLCPRCGGFPTTGGDGDIHCNECGYWTGANPSREEAIEWWNYQPLVDALRTTIATQAARIDELERMVERTRKWLPDKALDGRCDDE